MGLEPQLQELTVAHYDMRPLINSVRCPRCNRPPGVVCRRPSGRFVDPPHHARYMKWTREQLARERQS